MASKKPWEEDYADPKDSGPWDDYVESYTKQEELERSMGDTMGDAATVFVQGASHDFADEIAGGATAITGGNYREGRDAYREKVQGARENIGPIPSTAVETLGNVASTALIPGARAGKAATEIGLAAVQGVGAADEISDVPKSAGISTLVSGATQGVTKGLGQVLGASDPDKKLAKVIGARGQDFNKKGIEGWKGKETKKSPDVLAKKLDEMGFFRQGKVQFDTIEGKFKPAGSRLESFFQPQSLDDLHNRAMESVSALKSRNQSLLQGKSIPMNKLAETLKQAVEDYVPDGYNYAARLRAAENIVGTILNDLNLQGKIKRSTLPEDLLKPMVPGTKVSGNNMYIDATDVEGIKKQLYDEVKQTFAQGKSANDLNLGPEAQRKFSAKIDNLMDSYGGGEYKRNNDMMSDFLSATEMIFNKGSREAGYGMEGPRLTMGSQVIQGIKDLTVNNAPAGIATARMGQIPDSPAGAVFRNYVERFPTEAVNNNKQGRRPDSINIPEELIRTPLPRTTEGLRKNKNFVLAKVAQMAPDMFEAVKDTYEREPEMLSEIAPVLAQKMPHFFERDKYNRFDGRIMNEMDKSRAIKDTLSNSNLNSIQQAEIISKLNKDGIYDG